MSLLFYLYIILMKKDNINKILKVFDIPPIEGKVN